MQKNNLVKLLVFSPLALTVIIAFQNCGPSFTQQSLGSTASLASTSAVCTQTPDAAECAKATTCHFDGKNYSAGETVRAFLSSSVASNQACVSQNRICVDGAFSGSYTYSFCDVDAAKACLFNGQTIAHNQSVKAFQNSTVAAGTSCQSEDRRCTNGVLSGSATYASCSSVDPASCLFDGRTIAHAASVTAFLNSSVPNGQNCQSETRTCNNGTLSGSASFASCSPAVAASCLLNGQTIPSGGSVNAFALASVPAGQSCQHSLRVCTNGELSGSGEHLECSVQASTGTSSLYNFVAGDRASCEASIQQTLGVSGTCTIGGGCGLSCGAPGSSCMTANPGAWGACIDPNGQASAPTNNCLPAGAIVNYQNCQGGVIPRTEIQNGTESWSGCCSGTLARTCARTGMSTENTMICQ